jgi:uncharacterized membrane protein
MILGIVGRIIASGMLVWALAHHEYGYFTILRFVVCIVAAYCGIRAYSEHKEEWTWILGGIAVLFNPVIPIHLNRELWSVIDIIVAIVLIVSFFFIKTKKEAGGGRT